MPQSTFMADAFEVTMVMSEFSYRLDVLGGTTVHELFAPDGIYEIDGEMLVGRVAIRDAYARRAASSVRTTRHLFTDHRFEALDGDMRVRSVMVLYAADGAPVLPSAPPLTVADAVDVFTAAEEGWRLRHRTLTTVFKGAGRTVPPR